MTTDYAFIEACLTRSIASHAREEIMMAAPAVIPGFGLARLKEDGETVRYDAHAPFYFADLIIGKPTPARLRGLIGKAERYVWRVAGFRAWKKLAWRQTPIMESVPDFEDVRPKLKLVFRGSFFDD